MIGRVRSAIPRYIVGCDTEKGVILVCRQGFNSNGEHYIRIINSIVPFIQRHDQRLTSTTNHPDRKVQTRHFTPVLRGCVVMRLLHHSNDGRRGVRLHGKSEGCACVWMACAIWADILVYARKDMSVCMCAMCMHC